jgi:hypothetical protein
LTDSERAAAKKVVELLNGLSEAEREALRGAFAAARIHVGFHVPEHRSDSSDNAESLEEGKTLAELQQEIIDAFIPGGSAELMVYSRIGGEPVWPPRKPT